MGKNENDYLHREIIRGEKRGSVNGDARVYTRSGIREFYPGSRFPEHADSHPEQTGEIA
jgi:hypothetical protein